MKTLLLVGSICLLLSSPGWAQTKTINVIEQPDAERTRSQLNELLQHYPPSLREVLSLDPALASNEAYLASYPALVTFLNTHPEVLHNPAYYFPVNSRRFSQPDTSSSHWFWDRVLQNLSIFLGFAMAIGLVTWLIRTILDYRRWNRLAKVQTDVHTRLLDRFTGNDELLDYIKTPAGAKFLESSPIALDPGTRSVGAPLGRILWSVQAGLVLIAGGFGLQAMTSQVPEEASRAVHGLGVLCVALGIGFVISAVASFLISHRLGLIERPGSPRIDPPGSYVS